MTPTKTPAAPARPEPTAPLPDELSDTDLEAVAAGTRPNCSNPKLPPAALGKSP